MRSCERGKGDEIMWEGEGDGLMWKEGRRWAHVGGGKGMGSCGRGEGDGFMWEGERVLGNIVRGIFQHVSKIRCSDDELALLFSTI